MHVSTDKTKGEAWDSLIVFRVRSLLLREQRFQESIKGSREHEAVPYENRENSRFANIVPLFRSATSSRPVDDYYNCWTVLLTGFQDFYAHASGLGVQFITLSPSLQPGSVEPVVSIARDGAQFCPLSVKTINTPHACRSTFATNRQGVLEDSEIASLIGHEEEITTIYYQRHSAEDLAGKLEKSDRDQNDGWMFDRSSKEYIRADLPESNLVRSFNRSRDTTIQRFGFMKAAAIWSWSESLSKMPGGLELLQKSPISRIVFRETHICPVGEVCPAEVVDAIGEAKRCGVCPLAMKCIDHLPAVSAKKRSLYERVRYFVQRSESLSAMGEKAASDAAWESAQVDTQEYLGWKTSEDLLLEIYQEQSESPSKKTNGTGGLTYLVGRPDIVREHLKVVVRDSSLGEFLLRRVADSNAFPSMQTPEVQALSKRIGNRIMAGNGDVGLFSSPCADDVTATANLLRTIAVAKGLSIARISSLLESSPSYGGIEAIGAIDEK